MSEKRRVEGTRAIGVSRQRKMTRAAPLATHRYSMRPVGSFSEFAVSPVVLTASTSWAGLLLVILA
jgi:hypothetical protein